MLGQGPVPFSHGDKQVLGGMWMYMAGDKAGCNNESSSVIQSTHRYIELNTRVFPRCFM